MHRTVLWIALPAAFAGCTRRSAAIPPVTPATLLPGQTTVPYPAELYERRVEGEVLLYLVIDSSGSVNRDSTRIVTSSGQAAFDSAALAAAPTLRFSPATRDRTPVTAALQLPIRFTLPDSVRHSGARP